jgi:hypothetical protein
MLLFASGMCSAASTAAVSGMVRDTEGVAQTGAMVQVLTAGSVSIATAFTDIYGRYRIANLVPGRYQVRATAALFVPATRSNLQLATGMRATVNLTLNMLSDPLAWLPVTRRGPDEPGDDWTWTLRSAANRPILRLLDNGTLVQVAAGEADLPHHAPMQARYSTTGGAGGFGSGGLHTVVALDRPNKDGSQWVLRTDVAMQWAAMGNAPATEVDAGYERKAIFGNESRMVVSYASHPELVSAGSASGLQTMRTASAERMEIGDSLEVEAGGTVYAIHMAGDALTAQPFLRVRVHPGKVWAVQYRLATSRSVQGLDGLDSIQTALPVAAMNAGRLYTEGGRHQELEVSRTVGGGQVTAAIYHDAVVNPAITGSGLVSAEEMPVDGTSGLVIDTATDTFRFLGQGYTNDGVSLSVSEPLTPSLWAALEYASGAAVAMRSQANEGLATVSSNLHQEAAQELTAALEGRVLHTGTRLRASYRWQPEHLVTAVAPFQPHSDEAFLSFYVRQAVRWGDRLPQGLEATIDVTNLLAEGYQPFLSADGRTLYLAQSPRAIQGGLSFTF